MSSIAHTQQEPVASESGPHLHLASSLPPEILGEIFLRCIPPLIYHRDLRAHFPFNLTHVCSHWRVSALAFPELWSFLDVEQTRLNEQDRSRTLRLMKAYLERSGQHPLSFRLSYNPFDQMREQPLLECLSGHSMRWQTVVIEGASQFTLNYLEWSKPSDYSSLRSLDFFHCQLDSFDTSLPPFPWSQLSRYHEYDVSWYRDRDSVDQWSIVTQLTNVVDLRAAFDETFNGSRPIKMPRLRFASLAVSQVDEMLSCFEFPGIQGLNLMLTINQPPRTLQSVPTQLKSLRILRLSGELGVTIAKTALLCLLTELRELTDFAMALRGNHGVDATYLFTLLTPGRSLLVPRLQALRVATSEPVDGTVETLLVMLRQRFGGLEGMGRLKRFEIFLGLRPIVFGKRLPKSYAPSAMSQSLDWLRVHEGWDIRVVEEWQGDFWGEEMGTEFL